MGRVRQALDGIEPTRSSGDLGDALELAGKLAARSGDAQILVATDGALAARPAVIVDAPIKVLSVGRSHKNQAIVALAVRTAPSGVTKSVFVSVANLALETARRRLELRDGDGALIEVRDLRLDPQARSDMVIDDVPSDVGTIELRLVGPDPTVATAPDDLATDDRAWAVVPPDQRKLVLLVGEGDPYLETALSYLPNVELYGVTLDEYGPQTARTDGRAWDLTIFEGPLPVQLPRTPILAIAPIDDSELGDVTGTLENPGIGSLSPDEPVLRYVDLSTTHVAEATRVELPDWARSIIPGPKGAPLLYAGNRAGLPTAVLAFEPRQSDLPLQVAFPILLANLAGELMGGSAAPAEAVQPGTPLTLTIPSGASGISVTKPDGSVSELVPGTGLAATVTFAGTDLPGIYTVTPHLEPDATGGPSPSAPAVTPRPSLASPGASGGAASGQPSDATVATDPTATVRFAVDLFDVDESTIAPGAAAAIEGLGAAPSSAPAPGDPATTRPAARDELWIPLVLLVLLVLSVEWAVYHRDAVTRIRRGFASRLGRNPASERP